MQYELRLSTQEPRGVNAQSEIPTEALLGIALDHLLSFRIGPKALHLQPPNARPTLRFCGPSVCLLRPALGVHIFFQTGSSKSAPAVFAVFAGNYQRQSLSLPR